MQAQDIADMLTTTQYELGKNHFSDISSSYQHLEVMGKLLKEHKLKFDSGLGISRTVMVNKANAAKHVGLFEQDTINIVDLLSKIEVPWVHATTNYAIERREISMNKNAAKIVDLMNARDIASKISLAEELENKFVATPDAGNPKAPYGLLYWIVKNASKGFNGGVPSGFTTVGGINPTTYPTHKNYTGTYSAVSKSDLISLIREAIVRCNFTSPFNIPDFRKGNGQRFRMYLNYDLLNAIELVGEQQNENLGKDIAAMDGVTTIRRFPLVWLPALDADNTNPIYGVDMSVFHMIVLESEYLVRSKFENRTSHTVFETHTDISYNFVCDERRKNFVFYKA
jgi:hypothetical protein